MVNLLLIIGLILLILWVLGLVTNIMGSLVYILLVIALICLIIWLVQRIRRR
jgi:hypothetical protein